MTDEWKSLGAQYLPLLNAAGDKYALPRDLLARIAFQESSFRPGIITGLIRSPVGALGIMQLMPEYFSSVRAPVPFTKADITAQIDQAAFALVGLYQRFGDWQEAVAAYNWGGGNEHHAYLEHGAYRLCDMPTETQNYVRNVFADVPIQGVLL